MHTFIATLAGLSITSGVSAPLITNQVQDSSNVSLVTTEPLETKRITFNEQQKISTNQNSKTWQTTFTLKEDRKWNQGGIIFFEGGGLRASVGWGGDLWTYEWPYIPVNANFPRVYEDLIDEHHESGLADQFTKLGYFFDYNNGNNTYTLTFYFSTYSIHSLNGSWGNLVIGDALVFANEL